MTQEELEKLEPGTTVYYISEDTKNGFESAKFEAICHPFYDNLAIPVGELPINLIRWGGVRLKSGGCAKIPPSQIYLTVKEAAIESIKFMDYNIQSQQHAIVNATVLLKRYVKIKEEAQKEL